MSDQDNNDRDSNSTRRGRDFLFHIQDSDSSSDTESLHIGESVGSRQSHLSRNSSSHARYYEILDDVDNESNEAISKRGQPHSNRYSDKRGKNNRNSNEPRRKQLNEMVDQNISNFSNMRQRTGNPSVNSTYSKSKEQYKVPSLMDVQVKPSGGQKKPGPRRNRGVSTSAVVGIHEQQSKKTNPISGRNRGSSVQNRFNQERNREHSQGGTNNRRGQQNSKQFNSTDKLRRPGSTPRMTEQGRSQQKTRMKGVGFFRDLTEREPSQIVLALGSKENGFKELVNLQSMKPELIKILLILLRKCCSCASTPEILNQILAYLPNSTFLCSHVQTLFISVSGYESYDQQEEVNIVIKDYLSLLHEIGIRMPHSFAAIQGASTVVKMTIERLPTSSIIANSEIFDKLKMIESTQEIMFKKMQQESIKKTSGFRFENEPPPDDFRNISIFPVERDLDSGEQPYLRPNKVKGRYDDLDHYLDVQFRLLREDFIAPLREGISEYLSADDVGDRRGRTRKRITDLRVYDDVRVVSPLCTFTSLEYRLCFDITRFRRVNWAVTKRLIYGSLLCLSSDNFKTFLFATVTDRKPEDLKEGFVNVRFEKNDENILTIAADTRFIMAETTAYFGAYRHVLSGLQNVSAGDLPFECHIVECNADVPPPAYLRPQGHFARFDLRPLIDRNIVLQDRSHFTDEERCEVAPKKYKFSTKSQKAQSVKILDKESWPSAEELHLDDSQYTAIQTALTSQFVITQGPPGTGKTYIGLQIVKALLHNKDVWNVNQYGVPDHKPILIVCYTNHALDQFLEELSNFYKGDILRVGGRSSSEKLKPFNLKEIRVKVRKSRTLPREVFKAKMNAMDDMKYLKVEMDRLTMKIEAAEKDILHEDLLQPFMAPSDRKSFYSQTFRGFDGVPYKPNSFIVEWLELGLATNYAGVPETAELMEVDDADIEDDDLVDVYGEIDAMESHRRIDDDDDFFDLKGADALYHTKQNETNLSSDILQLDIGRCIAFDVSQLDKTGKGNSSQSSAQQWQMQKKGRKKMKQAVLKQLRSTEKMSTSEASQITDVWALPLVDKWRLYKLWVHSMCERIRSDLVQRVDQYQSAADKYQEILLQEDKEVIKRATVIGTTTTCAARYQSVLKEIGPRILVVEEAAEVLEAHVITTLSEGCEHLILIGDHQQLKPNPSVYKLAKVFNLEISLFERMIKNGMRCDTLQLQHRMRPEISSVLRHIYPNLKDHESVQKYEQIQGIGHNMYFISHTEMEEDDIDSRSHSNFHEAEYIVALCKYLILQGYKKSQITILTAYSGQLFQLRKLMPKLFFEGVQVTVVDNFQGEENDIILLSLVRSNEEGNVGFLKIENRICVALSRAKQAMYVIGNFGMLERKSDLWKNILSDLKKDQLVGPSLPLYCQIHPTQQLSAEKPEDFKKAPEGGCLKPCNFRLPCGHCCARLCHILDREHKDYRCQKPCEKIVCKNGHRCQRKCYQDCGPCEFLVEKIVPHCGHLQKMPCHVSPNTFHCQAECEKVLLCGHGCANRCGDNCTVHCNVTVTKTWPCGHKGDVRCHKKIDDQPCTNKCSFVLKCGHICSGSCEECFQGRLHKSCEEICNKKLLCHHQCKLHCSDCPQNYCIAQCDDSCFNCKKKCTWKCEHHKCTKRCFEDCDRPRCDKPCSKKLKCGHQCAGVCGELCPTLCRECNPEMREVYLGNEDKDNTLFVQLEDCGHTFTVFDFDIYMDDGGNDEQQQTTKMKVCPKCKTPITKSQRYGNIIKKIRLAINAVRKLKDIRKLNSDIFTESNNLNIEDRADVEKYMNGNHFIRTAKSLTGVLSLIKFLKEVQRIKSRNLSHLYGVDNSPVSFGKILKSLETLRSWLFKERTIMTEQECIDAQNEIYRLSRIIKLCSFTIELNKSNSPNLSSTLRVIEQALMQLQSITTPLNTEDRRLIDELVEKLQRNIPEKNQETVTRQMEVNGAKSLTKVHENKQNGCEPGDLHCIDGDGENLVGSPCAECMSEKQIRLLRKHYGLV